MNEECIKCGEHKAAIKKYQMTCGSVDPQTGELCAEFGRHRFKPWSDNELAIIQRGEEEIAKQMGEMAKMNGFY